MILFKLHNILLRWKLLSQFYIRVLRKEIDSWAVSREKNFSNTDVGEVLSDSNMIY